MRKHLTRSFLGAVILAASSGCSETPPPKPPPPKVEVAPKRVIPPLVKLLETPRAELAKQCDEILEEIRKKELFRLENPTGFALASELRLPLAMPVFREAVYSEAAGFSLPPYLPEGTHDNVLAMHVARFGDIEVALKLADPADKVTLSAINSLKTDRNYPLEWTRLVGAYLHTHQYAVGNVNIDFVKILLSLHEQLVELDNEQFPAGLRTALLPRGKYMLQRAGESWKNGLNADIARDINSLLVKWPNTQLPINCPPLSNRELVCGLFGAPATGKAVMANHPLRALDLLEIPLPDQGVEAVTALFDVNDRLNEILITYATAPADIDSARQISQQLEDWRAGEVNGKTATNCTYRFGDMTCEVTLTNRNPAVASVARLTTNVPMPTGIELPRDFGAIHLSGTFESNRASAALHERAAPLVLSKASTLEKISDPLTLPIDHVVLTRHASEDVIDELAFEFVRAADGPKTLAKIALPLFEKMGTPLIRSNPKGVTLHWEDNQTRYVLTLPDQALKAVRLVGVDVAPAKLRHERAKAWDLAERQERIETDEALVRLPRELESVALGMGRTQVHEAAAKTEGGQRFDVAGSDKFLWSGASDVMGPLLREMFVHYDVSGKANIIRVRYEINSQINAEQVLAPIRMKAGASLPLPSRAAQVWPELTPQPPPVLLEWQDDLSVLTCRREESVIELTLRDRPVSSSDSAAPPDLVYLSRGPDRCPLGSTRKELLTAWGVREMTVKGALMLAAPESTPYDAILVWFKDEKAVRIVARNRPSGRNLSDVAQASLAVREAWARQAGQFGWPWRQDFAAGNVLQSWGHHDDRTRVRIFWQDGNQGRQIFTEWMAVGH